MTMAQGCLNYTNHTLLPEALESWSEGLMGRLLPRHMRLIERIDDGHAQPESDAHSVGIAHDGQVKMGELSFIMAHKVNGVSALHTELMKKTVFKDLHGLHPDRIVNQTNGVTPRRWLLSCNPRLPSLITDTIGDGWVDDLEKLTELEPQLPMMRGFVERLRCREARQQGRAVELDRRPSMASRLTQTRCSTCRSSASTNTSASI